MEIPQVMRNAKEDLSATVSGRFSDGDWERILALARAKLEEQRRGDGDLEAWKRVMLDFHRNSYWGFLPYQRPVAKGKQPKNLGVTFIALAFQAFVISIMSVVWLGQNYTTSGESRDAWLLYAVMALVVANFAFFLWRNRNHQG